MQKLKMHTPNFTTQNLEKIKALFPNCITESLDNNGALKLAVDFDLLKQELSDSIVEGQEERYQLNWPGKREALITANAPINKTLRPAFDESVDFDNTQNLFIEGDNLEALKLLQETYLNKVKMIYIDPPYNTGKDFIYRDNFTQNTEEYLLESNQIDEAGNRFIANTESNGRFHSDWLSFIYPRLKLARNLLADDGVIFISIDDNEQANLKRLCDEVFGEENFVASFVWRKKTGASDAKGIAVITEYIILYSKDISLIDKSLTRNKNSYDPKRYRLTDEYENRRGKYYIDNLDRGGIQYSDSMNYPIECPDGRITYPNGRTEFKNDGWIWTWGKDKLKWGIKNGFIEFRRSDSKESGWSVCYKNYVNVNNKDELQERSAPHKNLILDIINTEGTEDISNLFDTKVFQYTKPVNLLKTLNSFVNLKNNDLILDFFAGSSTTAHAVMQLNAEDGGNRKFIMVQLPEPCNEKSESYKAGYKNIAEISKERIRRAGKKILEGNCHESWNKDIGFRVLKIADSNFADVYYTPNATTQEDLLFRVDNIKAGRTAQDLLFQVLLDLGVDLTLPITKKTLHGKTIFLVNADKILGEDRIDLIACFDDGVSEDLIKEIAKMKPLRAIFKDSGFVSDAIKINVVQIFQQLSKETEVKAI